jgi:hypothetical protein
VSEPIDIDDLHRVGVKVRELTADNWLADMVELACAEITRLREQDEWTPVLGGHPRNGQNVLACYVDSLGDEDVAELVFFSSNSDWFFVWPDGQAQHGVTHWKAMPIGAREALKRKDAGDAVA